ncbi:putative methyl-CpG-binding domain protein 3-like 3 [Rhynchocyon petersi]
MPQTSQKKQKHVSDVESKPALNSVFRRRLTSNIFPRPVTRVTSHPGNEVRFTKWGEELEKPRQLCAYKRLQGLQACSVTGELLTTLNFSNALKATAPGGPGKSLGIAGSVRLNSCSESTPGRSSNVAEIIPGVDMTLSSPLQGQRVTYGDVRRQMHKVKKVRERLAEALEADRLAKEAESLRTK